MKNTLRINTIKMIAVAVVISAIIVSSLVFFYRSDKPETGLIPVAGYSSSTINPTVQTSKYVTEYSVFPAASTNAIAVDTFGNVWFTIGSETSIGELVVSNQSIRTYQLPEPINTTILSWGIAADSARNLVWFTDQISNAVWNFNVTSHDFMRYTLPNARSSPYQVALDRDGNAWFTELDGGRLGEITTTGQIREYRVPLTSTFNTLTNSTGPAGIAISKDGTVWFAETYGNSVGSFSNGTFHQYNLNSVGVVSPTGIAIDSHGDVWITQHGASLVSELDPVSGHVTTISTSVVGVQESLPYFIQVDSYDNVWFNEHYGNAIARYDPQNGRLVEYEVPSRVSDLGNISGVLTLALSPGGTPWFTELYTGKIGMVNVSQPVDVAIRLTNDSDDTLSVPSRGNASLGVFVNSTPLGRVTLGGYAPGTNLAFNFTQVAGYGNFSSQMKIRDLGNSLELVTISAQTSQLVVSQVMQLEPTG